MRWKTLESFEGLKLEKMDVRRVAVVLFAIFFYYVDGRPAYPREAVSQRPWTGTTPRSNLEISDDNTINYRYVLLICLMSVIAVITFLGAIWICCYFDVFRRCRDEQKEVDLNEVVVDLKPDNVPSDSGERPDTGESMPMCEIPGCFLKDVISPSSIYVTNFQENKEELVTRLYRLYNETVFNNQLPDKMKIVWTKTLVPKSGKTCYKMKNDQRYAEIELSDQVLNSAERLRSTLAHEMCHAACWIINAWKDGHGPLWKAYAKSVTDIHPELPEIRARIKVAENKWYCPWCGGRLHQLTTTYGCHTNKSNSG